MAFDADSSPLCTRANALTVRGINHASRTADFIASTEAIDVYGERVKQNWDLTRYLANPVVLFAHNSCALPIGKAVRVAVVKGNLECTIEFAPEEANEKAEEVWQLVVGGFLKAVSVGFLPHTCKYEKENDKEVFILDDNELFEISIVSVPANPEALAKMKSAARARQSGAASLPSNTESNGPPGLEENPAMGRKEFAMNEAQLREALEKKDADLATAKKETDALALRAKALTEQNETLVAERDAALAKAAELSAKGIEAEVEALVGKKITPAEKASFVELATKDRTLFAKMIEQRSDLTILSTESALGADPTVAKAAAASLRSSDPSDVSDIVSDLSAL